MSIYSANFLVEGNEEGRHQFTLASLTFKMSTLRDWEKLEFSANIELG